MTRRPMGEEEADDIFRADAEKIGYLSPGGAGLYQYYADFGLVQPQRYAKIIQKREVTGLNLESDLENIRDRVLFGDSGDSDVDA